MKITETFQFSELIGALSAHLYYFVFHHLLNFDIKSEHSVHMELEIVSKPELRP